MRSTVYSGCSLMLAMPRLSPGTDAYLSCELAVPCNGFIQIGPASRDARPGALPSKPRWNVAAPRMEGLRRHARNIARGITALSRDDSVLWDPPMADARMRDLREFSGATRYCR